jgi:hypothetical protein
VDELATIAAKPSPRFGHTLTYDAARRQLVLFSGSDGDNDLNDTWVLDWTSL